METTAYEAFLGTVFKNLCFHLSTLETERFQNDTFSKGYIFKTFFESLHFQQRFRSFKYCGQ